MVYDWKVVVPQSRANLPVSFIIPTYNGKKLLEKNLPAVLQAARLRDEVVIVDDASTDKTLVWLRSRYKLKLIKRHADFDVWQASPGINGKRVQMTVVHNHTNLRFAASVNRGVELSHHPYVFLLNNDVKPHRDVLKYLLPHFQDPEIFAVGCHEHEAAQGGISGGKNQLWFERGLFQHARADDYETGSTAWASGGSALFDKAKWLELGGFDLAYYPAYWEDVDLSYRARLKGWKVWFEARAEVDHNHETTNADVFGQERIGRLSWQHAQYFTKKNGDWWQRLQYRLWQPYWQYQRQKLQQVK